MQLLFCVYDFGILQCQFRAAKEKDTSAFLSSAIGYQLHIPDLDNFKQRLSLLIRSKSEVLYALLPLLPAAELVLRTIISWKILRSTGSVP